MFFRRARLQPCRKRLGKRGLAPEESWYFQSSDSLRWVVVSYVLPLFVARASCHVRIACAIKFSLSEFSARESFSFFSTLIHNFAQTISANSIDAASGQVYLARRLNRKRNDFTVRFRLRDILTVVAILNGTGEFKDFPIQQGSCKSLTAIAAPNWVE
jgi:hypothetical protein